MMKVCLLLKVRSAELRSVAPTPLARQWKLFQSFTLAGALVIAISSATHASTVKAVDFTEAVNGSELVFEGVVVSKYSSVSPDTGQPFTYFQFHIQDVIKGTYRGQTITLGYLGGPKDDRFLVVTGMKMPEVGESGIYFVESTSRQQVHPLYGWQQWQFIKYVDTDGVTKARRLEAPVDPASQAQGANQTSPDPTVGQVKDAIRATAGQRR